MSQASAILVSAALFSALACTKDEPPADRPPPPPTGTTAEEPVEPLDPPSPPTPELSELALPDVLTLLAPTIVDGVDRHPPATLALTTWAQARLAWAHVETEKNETTLALVKKDSEPHIGKRVCVRGRIQQIYADHNKTGKLYRGIMRIGRTIVSFAAVRDTGDLVERSRARLCGLVAGNYAYRNTSGGQTQSVHLIGIFDLPANRGD